MKTQACPFGDRASAVLIVSLAATIMSSVALGQQPAAAPPAAAPAPPNPPATVPPVPASTPEQEQLRLVPAKRYPGKVHLLPATMETTQWGWFNNSQPAVLHVDSGDSIVFETMMHSHNQVVPGTTIEQIKKLRTDFPGRGPHTLTGPVYIEGAEPGDVLKVRINKIVPRAYGTNFNVPGMFGEFPGKFPDGQVKYFYLDRDLNKALEILTSDTTQLLMEQRKVAKDQAQKTMMASWDCRVTQVVDVNKGLHCFTAKNSKVAHKIEPLPERENKTYLVTVGRDADLNKAMDDASWAMIELL